MMPSSNRPSFFALLSVLGLLGACGDDATVVTSGGSESSDDSSTSGSTSTTEVADDTTSGGMDGTGTDSSGSSTGTMVQCGNDVREDGEECDEGDLNADDWNCMADCTINPVQRLILDSDEAAEQADAVRTTEYAFDGRGSWCNALGEDLNSDGVDKFEVYWDPEQEVPIRDDDDPFFYTWGPTLLSELVDARYHSYRTEPQGERDFYVGVYTREDGRDDTGSFYGYFLIGEPRQALRLEHDLDQWVGFRTDAPDGDEPNVITFFDPAFTEMFEGQPAAADLLGTKSFDWSTWNPVSGMPSSIDYGSEFVQFVSIQTGSGWDGFEGCVDSLTLWHTDGRQLIIEFE